MRRLALIASVTAVLAGFLCGDSQAARQFCSPGSFLAAKVTGVDSLVGQVSSNPTVAKRYARLYGTTPAQVVSYFKTADLRMVTLQKPMKTSVYFVGEKSGKISRKTKVLPAGTKIFTAKDGTPVMAQKCGNPLRREMAKLPKPAPKPVVEKTESSPPVEAVVPPVVETPAPVEKPAPVQVAVLPPVQENLAVTPITRTNIPIAAKLAVPALVAIGGVHTSGGGGAVPEPGTVIAALSILIPAGVLFRRRGA